MKSVFRLFSLSVLLSAAIISNAQDAGQDSTGLPGDNFDLQGALQLFKQAGSPEEFEKLLNTASNNVNNLDLDGDGDIDYIRVIDKPGKDVHAFVLQVPVSEKESQDIAVIELEKTGNESAVVQIIGDEDIYGEEMIVEPSDEGGAYNDYQYNSNNSGPSAEMSATGVIVNVWVWPSVRFVFGVGYRPWVSPWRWHYYPTWWKPWRPRPFHVFHPLRVHYHRPFVVVHTHRVMHAHAMYRPYRTTSVTVRSRHSASVNHYRVTRTKTTITGPRGNSATRTRTTVSGPRGNKVHKTKVRRH